MKNSIRKVFVVFKYMIPAFTIVFWIYMIIDDYARIKEYGVELIGILLYYNLIYLVGFSIYFWAISLIGILVYHKLIKRKKEIS